MIKSNEQKTRQMITTNTEINYYIFDKIEQDEDGLWWGYLRDKFCEVFHSSEDGETEPELIKKGFAKCDAPGTETFLVAESDITVVNGRVEIV
jgi:hypothetical protein